MPISTNKQRYETEIATLWLDDSGILVTQSKSPKRTVANISENVAMVKKITNNTPVPLLTFLTKSPVPDKETRDFATAQLPTIYTAMAMVSAGGLGAFIMNLLFRFKPPAIPMKTFSNEQDARKWLMQYL